MVQLIFFEFRKDITKIHPFIKRKLKYDHQRKVANQRIRKVKMEILFIGNSPFQSSDSVNLDSGAIFCREKTGRLGDRSDQFFVDIYHLRGYPLLNKGLEWMENYDISSRVWKTLVLPLNYTRMLEMFSISEEHPRNSFYTL